MSFFKLLLNEIFCFGKLSWRRRVEFVVSVRVSFSVALVVVEILMKD